MNYMFGNSISMSAKSLEFLWAKQQVIAGNLANVDTPGYKAKYVTFEEEFRNRLRTADAMRDGGQMRQAIEGSLYRVQEKPDSSTRLDENNVNADVENVEMARTSLQYQQVLNSITSDVNRLRSVIRG